MSRPPSAAAAPAETPAALANLASAGSRGPPPRRANTAASGRGTDRAESRSRIALGARFRSPRLDGRRGGRRTDRRGGTRAPPMRLATPPCRAVPCRASARPCRRRRPSPSRQTWVPGHFRRTEVRERQPLMRAFVIAEDRNDDLRMIVQRLEHPREPELNDVGRNDRGLDWIPEVPPAAGIRDPEHALEINLQSIDRAKIRASMRND